MNHSLEFTHGGVAPQCPAQRQVAHNTDTIVFQAVSNTLISGELHNRMQEQAYFREVMVLFTSRAPASATAPTQRMQFRPKLQVPKTTSGLVSSSLWYLS
jgi:hypothetical protein